MSRSAVTRRLGRYRDRLGDLYRDVVVYLCGVDGHRRPPVEAVDLRLSVCKFGHLGRRVRTDRGIESFCVECHARNVRDWYERDPEYVSGIWRANNQRKRAANGLCTFDGCDVFATTPGGVCGAHRFGQQRYAWTYFVTFWRGDEYLGCGHGKADSDLLMERIGEHNRHMPDGVRMELVHAQARPTAYQAGYIDDPGMVALVNMPSIRDVFGFDVGAGFRRESYAHLAVEDLLEMWDLAVLQFDHDMWEYREIEGGV